MDRSPCKPWTTICPYAIEFGEDRHVHGLVAVSEDLASIELRCGGFMGG
jgi:hypothetical protein